MGSNECVPGHSGRPVFPVPWGCPRGKASNDPCVGNSSSAADEVNNFQPIAGQNERLSPETAGRDQAVMFDGNPVAFEVEFSYNLGQIRR